MSRIEPLLEEHEAWRSKGVNLIASENRPSEAVRAAMGSDLQARYHSPWYGGTRVVRSIFEETAALAREVFGCRYAVVTSPAGNLCDLATLLAFTGPGGSVAMVPEDAGGYPLDVALFGRRRVDLPMKGDGYEIDEERLEGGGPEADLVLCGSSFLPFPHPVGKLRAPGRRVVFDGSHVLGLVATGAFPNPLSEGADALIGSTHKSLPGPQGGLVLTDDEEVHAAYVRLLDFGLGGGIGLVDNPHPGRVAALGLALEEMMADPGYGRRVVANARALARALEREGVPVRFGGQGYTQSHQIFLAVDLEDGARLSAALEKEGVFVDIAGRLGTAEVTRRGMTEADMPGVARALARAWHGLGLPRAEGPA